MSFFGTNPFTSAVGQKIEQATSDTLPSEDWGLNLEICDLINTSEEVAKDAVRAIRKRLTHTPKNYKIVLYTLVVLETCVKNTGHKFHLLVCSKDFVQDLVKLIGPKNEPPSSVQEKVLSLIQAWTEAFRNQPELAGVSQVYAELKHKGIEFPPPPADATPIITPSKSTSPKDVGSAGAGGGTSPRPPTLGGAAPRHPPAPSPPQPPPTQSPIPSSGTLTAEVRAKIQLELAVVESNSSVLAEMLSELTPGQEHSEDLQLLQELHATCEAMQRRVVELVARVTDDLLTADLLKVNDLLNNLFIRYDRHMSKSRAKGSPVKSVPEGGAIGSSHRPPPRIPTATPTDPPVAAAAETSEVSLIDLADDPAPPPMAAVGPSPSLLSQQLGQLDITSVKKADDAEFDSFAQSRTLSLDTAKRDEGAAGNGLDEAASIEPEQVETNFDSMERWMSSQPYGAEISSDAFQKFLSERAAVAEMLPTIPAATGSAPPPAATGSGDKRPVAEL